MAEHVTSRRFDSVIFISGDVSNNGVSRSKNEMQTLNIENDMQ